MIASVNPDRRNILLARTTLAVASTIARATMPEAHAQTSSLNPQPLPLPDFGDRFWVYQIVDLRTDSFVQLGKMYGTTPGFYLLVGPNWNSEVPQGITRTFRASSNTGLVAPRVAQNDTPEDKRVIQRVLTGIAMYPHAKYDGRIKRVEWSKLPKVPGALLAQRKRDGYFLRGFSTNSRRCSPTRRRRRRHHAVCPKRVAGRRQGGQLASHAEGTVFDGDAALLAEALSGKWNAPPLAQAS